MGVTYISFCCFFNILPLHVQSNQQEVHRIETIKHRKLEEEECPYE